MKKTTIEIPIWEFDLTIMVQGDVKDILKEATKRKFGKKMIDEIIKDNIQPSNRGAAYFCEDRYEAIMWFPSTRIDKSTVNHEVRHLVDWASLYIGAEREMEFCAYTTEYLNKVINQTLKKLRNEEPKT